jgi:hypothetical protein
VFTFAYYSIRNIDFDSDIRRAEYSRRPQVVGHILDYEVLCPGKTIGFYSGNPTPLKVEQEIGVNLAYFLYNIV